MTPTFPVQTCKPANLQTMNTEPKYIETNIEIGEQIFESVPNDLKPIWAGIILAKFNNYIKHIPEPINGLYDIIKEPGQWKKAHNQFGLIRRFLLANKKYPYETYLLLAESIAKITYNASGEPAPFDWDSGHYISSLALQSADYFKDERLEKDLKAILLLFGSHRTMGNDLPRAKEILQYQIIDDILWYDWDPIGINDIAPRDEYQSYIPQIFSLFKEKTNRVTIAKTLSKIETDNMGLTGNFEKCMKIADKILAIDKVN
jgi:hypothetical protein